MSWQYPLHQYQHIAGISSTGKFTYFATHYYRALFSSFSNTHYLQCILTFFHSLFPYAIAFITLLTQTMAPTTTSPPNLRALRKETREIKTYLSHMVPDNTSHKNYLCVAGSAPLTWYLVSHYTTVSKQLLFFPNDIDIFVFGEPAATKRQFRNYVRWLLKHTDRRQYPICEYNSHDNWYVFPDRPIHIIDIKVRHMRPRISFVQCPADSTPQQVVDRFDINIVQVIYDIKTGRISIADDIISSIFRQEATVRDLIVHHQFLPRREFKIFAMTLRRINKYEKRGFVFKNPPKFVCDYVQGPTHPPLHIAQRFPPRLPHRLRAEDKIEQALAILNDTLPPRLLQQNKIGFCKDAILQLILDTNYYNIPSYIQQQPVMHMINIHVCGDIAPTQHLFFEFMRRFRLSLWQHGYLHVFLHKRRSTSSTTDATHYTRYALHVINTLCGYNFIWSPQAEDLHQLAEQAPFGILRMWLDYKSLTPRLCRGVKMQLLTGMSNIAEIPLPQQLPNSLQRHQLESHLHKVESYQEHGWRFCNNPTFIPPIK